MKKFTNKFSGKTSTVIWILASVCGILSFVYYLSTGTEIVIALISAAIILFLSMLLISVIAGAVIGVFESIIPHQKSLGSTEQTASNAQTISYETKEYSSPYKYKVDPVCKIVRTAFSSPTAKNLESIRSYVVLDTETTGLSRKNDRIVEISLARYENGVQVDRYSTLVNPQIPISPAASRVNHITDSDVATAPTFSQIWPEVYRLMQGAIIVGHNVTFDLDMIGFAMPHSASSLTVQYLDTITLSKIVFPGRDSYKLVSLVKDLGFSNSQTHRAEDDVTLTTQLFEYCRSQIIEAYHKELTARRLARKNAKAEKEARFSWSSMLNKNFVFTGDFQQDRKILESSLEKVGANLRDEVNGNTDYLVKGSLANLPDWAVERKYKKALMLAQNGKKVKIIDEAEYKSLLHAALCTAPKEFVDLHN